MLVFQSWQIGISGMAKKSKIHFFSKKLFPTIPANELRFLIASKYLIYVTLSMKIQVLDAEGALVFNHFPLKNQISLVNETG